MGESTNKSASEVDAAPVIAAPDKPLRKGKREAEDAIENEMVSAKKQNLEAKDSEAKTEKKVVEKKVETFSEENAASSEPEQQIKVMVSAKNGHARSDSENESSGLEEEANAAQKNPAAAAKSGHVATSEKKDESSDDPNSSSEDETILDEDVGAARKVPASMIKKGPIAPAKKTAELCEDSGSSSEDETSLEEDIAAANKASITPSTKKSVVSTQMKDECTIDESNFDDETSSDENVAKANKAAAPPTKEGTGHANQKKDESSSYDEGSGEYEVTGKNNSAAVTETKNESRQESELDNETSSSDADPKTPATPKEQTTGPKTLFVGNLSFSVWQEDVEDFFKTAGEVVNIRFGMNPDESFRGFGYVEFASAEAAQKAFHELNGKELLRRPVRLDFLKERGSYTPYSGSKDTESFQKVGNARARTIFIRGFNKSDGADQIRSSLEEHFGSCGEITRISVLKDHDGGVKGIAYIDFKDSDAFNQALELNGSKVGGSTLLVERAKPRPISDSFDSVGAVRGRGRSGGRSGGWDFGGRSGGWDFGGRSGWQGFGGRSSSYGGRGCFGGGGRGRETSQQTKYGCSWNWREENTRQ